MEIKDSICRVLGDLKIARKNSKEVDNALKEGNNKVQVNVDEAGKLLGYSFTINIPGNESEPIKNEDRAIGTFDDV